MRDLSIGGKAYQFGGDGEPISNALPEHALLAELLDSIDDQESNTHSLPRILLLDGKKHDTYYWRVQLAIGRSESSMEVSDVDVLRLITRKREP